jgi:hypothetical protein
VKRVVPTGKPAFSDRNTGICLGEAVLLPENPGEYSKTGVGAISNQKSAIICRLIHGFGLKNGPDF